MFGQVYGADEALKAAANRGWEAVFLVVIVVSILVAFGYIMKRILDDSRVRESRLAERVTALESEIRTELFSQLKSNTAIMERMVAAAAEISAAAKQMTQWTQRVEDRLVMRPCLFTMLDQGKLMGEIDELVRKHAHKETT